MACRKMWHLSNQMYQGISVLSKARLVIDAKSHPRRQAANRMKDRFLEEARAEEWISFPKVGLTDLIVNN